MTADPHRIGAMRVLLVDGTYELFRHFHAVPAAQVDGVEIAATRAVVRSLLGELEAGHRHVAVATDTVIESFRNDLWEGYKTGEGIEPELRGQFGLLEEALAALGLAVWAMRDFEADDALAAGAARAALDPEVEQVLIASPDKDLAQAVDGARVVQLDRRRGLIRTAPDVRERFGVAPASIPDWLALVGDSADGYPGLPGWGEKSAAAVLGRWGHLENIPPDPGEWDVAVRGAARLSETLERERDHAVLFRTLATLRLDAPVLESGVDSIRWSGPRAELPDVCRRLDASDIGERVLALLEGEESSRV